MSTLTAINQICDNSSLGGIGAIYMIERSDLTDYTLETTGDISAMTLVSGGTFVQVGFVADMAQAVAEPQDNDQGQTVGFNNNLTKTSYGLDATKLVALENARICSFCGLVVMWRTSDGEWWVGGLAGDRPNPGSQTAYDPSSETGQVYFGFGSDSGEGNTANFTVNGTFQWKTKFHYRQWQSGATLPNGVTA